MWRKGAWVSPVVTDGGYAVAVWDLRDERGSFSVRIDPFDPLPRRLRTALRTEADRLAGFLETDVEMTFAG